MADIKPYWRDIEKRWRCPQCDFTAAMEMDVYEHIYDNHNPWETKE